MFFVKVKDDVRWASVVVAGRTFVKAEEIPVAEADMVDEIRMSPMLTVREEKSSNAKRQAKKGKVKDDTDSED